MTPPVKLASYGVLLGLVLTAGAGLGRAVGPVDDAAGVEPAGAAGAGAAGAEAAVAETVAPLPAGLSASQAGFTFAPHDAIFTAGVAEPFTFAILGPDGRPVTGFDRRHERDLHLVVTSDDLAHYQHLHPARAADGTWTTTLRLPAAGGYRAYADFAPAGAAPLTLTARLSAAGELYPQPLPPPATTATVDGYEVRVEGEVAAGKDSELVFRVARSGAGITDLEPYLGAYGHLVAIRASDGAYLHVHPTPASSPGQVPFAVHAPTPGLYRLFLDFQHRGVVRTAAFTLDVPAGAARADGLEVHGARSAGATGAKAEEDDHGGH